ncbi:hypothetical protein [Bradyrhizobium sp. BR 1432]|uniref:hypothetical protein n=1 Tax=Bradyrhizobium sp. BR 1432 TaxID=3447966 RepID=UPI003EE6C3C2
MAFGTAQLAMPEACAEIIRGAAERIMPAPSIRAFRSFSRVGKEELLKALGNPYTSCFHWLVQSLLELLRPNKKEIIKNCARKEHYEKEAKASFEFISKNANPNKAPMRLLFGGELEQMPLQTADIWPTRPTSDFRNLTSRNENPGRSSGLKSPPSILESTMDTSLES